MDMLDRNIAITDVETSGLDPAIHEIIEIGLVVVNQKTFEIVSTIDYKVKPEHPEVFSEEAWKINGYDGQLWKNAVSLSDTMKFYGVKTKDAIFCAHNVTFDWGFISEAFKKTGEKMLMDYHRLDLLTIAWTKLRNHGLKKFNMNEVAKFLGIPEEPMPHRAINGAMTEYKILKTLVGGHVW